MKKFLGLFCVLMVCGQAMAAQSFSASKMRVETALDYAPLKQLLGDKPVDTISIQGNSVLVTAENCTYSVDLNEEPIPGWGRAVRYSVAQVNGPSCK